MTSRAWLAGAVLATCTTGVLLAAVPSDASVPMAAVPNGAKGWDSASSVDADDVQCMKDNGFVFALLYTNIEATNWQTTYSAMTARGMEAILQQGFVNGAFYTDPDTGTSTAQKNVAAARSVDYPAGADFFLDLETPVVNRQTVIQWINNWAQVISEAGYTPGLYSGLPSPLDAADLAADTLPDIQVYWQSGSRSAPDPAQGYVAVQSLSKPGPCEFQIDEDTARIDQLGNQLVGSSGPDEPAPTSSTAEPSSTSTESTAQPSPTSASTETPTTEPSPTSVSTEPSQPPTSTATESTGATSLTPPATSSAGPTTSSTSSTGSTTSSTSTSAAATSQSTVTVAAASLTTTPKAAGGGGGGHPMNPSGGLAYTGFEVARPVLAAATALGLGAVLVGLARRRRAAQFRR